MTLVAPVETAPPGQTAARRVAAPRKLGRRPVLDGLRGVAILLVMLCHTDVIHNGFMGVDLFFGLSGFLITTLLYEEWERTGGISFRRFYERRARRLLPALLLVTATFAVIDAAFDPFTGWPLGERVVTTLAFVNNWVAGFGHSGDLGALNPTWSLAQEEQFYLLWPLALWLALRRGVRPATLLAALGAAVAVLILAVPYVHAADPAYSNYFSPLDRGAELLLGCAGAIVWRHRLIRLPERQWLRALLATPLIAVFVWILLYDRQIDERSIFLSAAALAVPVMLLLLDAPDTLLARLLSIRPLRYVGRISYCLYLAHLLIHNLLIHYVPGQPKLFYVVATIGSSMVVAGISWRLLESRVLSAGRGVRGPALPAWRRTEVQIAR